jgi:hypothetical protein
MAVRMSKIVFFMLTSLDRDNCTVADWVAVVASLRGNTEKPAKHSQEMLASLSVSVCHNGVRVAVDRCEAVGILLRSCHIHALSSS